MSLLRDMICAVEMVLRMEEDDYGQELREWLAPGVSPEHVDGLEEAEGILVVARLARSLFSTTGAATPLKLVVLFQLARAEGRFSRERIRSLNRSIAENRLDDIVTSLHNGGWLELRDVDRTYRVSPIGHYFLSVLRAAGFAGQGSANLLIRAAETVRFGAAVDAGSETRLLGLLLAQTESVAERAQETLRVGRPRDLIRFSREEVRSQLEHVDQVLRALEERFQHTPALFEKIVRIHEAMQKILRAHKGLQDRLAEWNLKTLETAGAGYSLTSLCDAVMGATDEEVLATVANGAVTVPGPVVAFSTEDAITRSMTSRIAARTAREAFVYEAPSEPRLEALRLEDVDPVARLRTALRGLSKDLAPGEVLPASAWLEVHATDFADAVFLLNLLAWLEGRTGKGIDVDGVMLLPETPAADPEAWRDMDPEVAIQALQRLGVLARVPGKGIHTDVRLRRVSEGGCRDG
ncbi:MAG: hypothetical protein KA745_01845 [Gemmatimonadales bacterium]|nr:hypothetical protein [Gemmatimonadales bacterium]